MSGTAIAQGIGIASAPILSRLYNPADFGLLALYGSIVSVIAVVASWRYELAIVLPKKDEDAARVLLLACFIVLGMSALSALIVLVGRFRIANLLGAPDLASWFWWAPLSILASGFYNALNYWSTRNKQFKRLSISRVSQSGAAISAQTSGGVVGLGVTGLIGGQLIGSAVATIVLGSQVLRDDKQTIRNAFDKGKMKRLLKEYIDFPKYSAPQSFLNSISQNIPAFLLAYFFGVGVVGFYALSTRLLRLPISLIGNSTRQVFFQKASETFNNNGDIRSLLKKATFGLVITGIVPSLIIIMFGKTIFSFILGEKWVMAGIYSQLLMPFLFMLFINPPAIASISVLRLQKQALIFDIILLFTRILTLTVFSVYGNAILAIGAFAFVGVVFNLFIIIYVYRKAGIYPNNTVYNTKTVILQQEE